MPYTYITFTILEAIMNQRKHLYRRNRKNQKSEGNKKENLSLALKASTAAVSCALAVTMNNTPLHADMTFVPQTAGTNPLDGVHSRKPSFVDIDNDGDSDLFLSGEGYVRYYENTNNNKNPMYEERFGEDNPLGYLGPSSDFGIAEFVDMDSDGDLDCIIAQKYSPPDPVKARFVPISVFNYYENVSDSEGICFERRTGHENPLDTVMTYGANSVSYVDIDSDGDMDLFIAQKYSYALDKALGPPPGGNLIAFYENIGNNEYPRFTERTDEDNPFYDIVPPYSGETTLSLADLDGDGDFDAYVGGIYGEHIDYFRNNGTKSDPLFELQDETDNPFDKLNVGFFPTPVFIDVDNDGDLDSFVGNVSDNILFYRNSGSATNPNLTLPTGNNPFYGVDVGLCFLAILNNF